MHECLYISTFEVHKRMYISTFEKSIMCKAGAHLKWICEQMCESMSENMNADVMSRCTPRGEFTCKYGQACWRVGVQVYTV